MVAIAFKHLEHETFDQMHFIKRLRGEASRYIYRRKNDFQKKESQSVLERVITVYLCNHHAVEYSPNLVYLCGPLLHVFYSEQMIYYGLCKLTNLIGMLMKFIPRGLAFNLQFGSTNFQFFDAL